MRPRRIRRGTIQRSWHFIGYYEGGFNEAPANSLGNALRPLPHQTGSPGFNEAPANSPGERSNVVAHFG